MPPSLAKTPYPGIHEKAAALLQSVVWNPRPTYGNKRLGLAAVIGSYGVNGVPTRPGQRRRLR